ncbi:ribosomal protein S8 [Russula vinacea]|nr:ribosomal protein S8 [Russula vinacea]
MKSLPDPHFTASQPFKSSCNLSAGCTHSHPDGAIQCITKYHHEPLSLSTSFISGPIVNAERRGKHQVLIRLSSKVAVKFLSVMQRHGYIGDFDIIDDHRSGKIAVQLNGRLNKSGVISSRFNVQVTQIESWVNLLLPARSFGKLILVNDFLDHEEARRKNVDTYNPIPHSFICLLVIMVRGWKASMTSQSLV